MRERRAPLRPASRKCRRRTAETSPPQAPRPKLGAETRGCKQTAPDTASNTPQAPRAAIFRVRRMGATTAGVSCRRQSRAGRRPDPQAVLPARWPLTRCCSRNLSWHRPERSGAFVDRTCLRPQWDSLVLGLISRSYSGARATPSLLACAPNSHMPNRQLTSLRRCWQRGRVARRAGARRSRVPRAPVRPSAPAGDGDK